MDISAISNNMSFTQEADIRRQDAKLNDFQSIFDAAVNKSAGEAATEQEKAEIKKACVEFESYFIQQMFSSMRKTVDSTGGLFPKSQAENIFQDMLDEENSKSIAKSGGIGLADMMYKQMIKNI